MEHLEHINTVIINFPAGVDLLIGFMAGTIITTLAQVAMDVLASRDRR